MNVCRKYVPEVRRLPLKYLFEPWKAPMRVQKRARCIVGEDYPEPVVDHIEQRRICVERLNDMCTVKMANFETLTKLCTARKEECPQILLH